MCLLWLYGIAIPPSVFLKIYDTQYGERQQRASSWPSARVWIHQDYTIRVFAGRCAAYLSAGISGKNRSCVCVCVWYGTQENRKCAKIEKKGRKMGRCFLFRLVLFLLGVSSFLIFFLSKTSRVEIDVSAVVVEEDGRRPDSYDKDVPYPKRKGKEKGKQGKMRRLCWLLRVLL